MLQEAFEGGSASTPACETTATLRLLPGYSNMSLSQPLQALGGTTFDL